MKECNHHWKIKEEHELFFRNILFGKGNKEKVIVLQCNKCGYVIQRFIPLGDVK